MMHRDLEKDPSSMFDDPCSDRQQMISERFKANRPPGLGQGFPFHNCKDIVGEDVQSPSSGIGEESFGRKHPAR